MIETLEELERVRQNCRALVRRRARAAGVLSMIPVPGLDLAGDVALLLEAIPAINRRFGLTPEQIDALDSPTKLIVYRIARRLGAPFVGQLVTADLIVLSIARFGISLATETVAKYIPVVGTMTSAVIAYEVFKRIAYSHIEQCTKIFREMLAPTETDAR